MTEKVRQTLRSDLAFVRENVREMDADSTTPETRLADYLMGFNPVAIHGLTNLTTGAYLAGNIWTLHSRFWCFDPVQRRAGLPEGVAALVEKLEADSATLVLVNVDAVEPHTVAVEAGGYWRASIRVSGDGRENSANCRSAVERALAPGAGARLRFRMARYVNPPTLAQPWDRGWFGKP